MVRNFYLFFALCLLSRLCIGQEQITNFKGQKSTNSTAVNYQSEINGKLIFSTFTPETGTELWVSQGSKENTKLLKDVDPGSSSSSFSDFTKYNNLLYFRTSKQEIWKTDGTTAGTSKVLHSDSLMNIYAVSGKLLVTFSGDRMRYAPQILLGWLDNSGKIDFWEKDANAVNIFENKLYYSNFNKVDSVWSLKVYDTASDLIFEKAGGHISMLNVEKYKGYEYLSFQDTQNGKSLVVANGANRTEKATLHPWVQGFAPATLKDSTGTLFLLKDGYFENRSLKFQAWKVISGNNWEEIANIPASTMYYMDATTNEGPYFNNFSIQGNNLAYTSMYGIESLYSVFLNVFDIKTNKKRISKKLPALVTTRELQIRQKSVDLFHIGTPYVKCIYNIASDTTISIDKFPLSNTPVQVGNNKFEISDNLYNVTTSTKKPLLTSKDRFEENWLTYRDTLNNKILFWTYSQELKKNQLWSGDGSTTQQIFDYEGQTDSYWMSNSLKKLRGNFVFVASTENGIKVFKTDGTTEGTKELYTYKGTEPAFVRESYVNDNEVLLEIASGSKIFHLVTNLERTNELDISKFPYHSVVKTKSTFYVVENTNRSGWSFNVLYKIENGALKLINLNANGDAHFHQAFGDRLYYSIRNKAATAFNDIYSLDNSDNIKKVLTTTMDGFSYQGNYLLINSRQSDESLQRTTVVNAFTLKTLYNAGTDFAICPSDFDKSNLAIWNQDKVVTFTDGVIEEHKFNIVVEQVVSASEGFVIRGNSSTGAYYYYFKTKTRKLIPILTNTQYGLSDGYSKKNLIFNFSDGFNLKSAIWNVATEKLVSIEETLRISRELNGSFFTVYKNENYANPYVYTLENGTFTERYQLNGQYGDNVTLAGASNYFPTYAAKTGFEITRLDHDSLYHFAEIVKGPEGIAVQEIFEFKGGVYASGFTYSKGLQVWKMGAATDQEDEEEEETIEGHDLGLPDKITFNTDKIDINTFPNPATSELNVFIKNPGIVRMVDEKGLEIFKSYAEKQATIDIKTLNPGIYYIIYSNGLTLLSKKVVKL